MALSREEKLARILEIARTGILPEKIPLTQRNLKPGTITKLYDNLAAKISRLKEEELKERERKTREERGEE